MKIIYPIRTCSTVFNYWDSTRFVNADKGSIAITCINSLLKSIKHFDHDYAISVHDDNSDSEFLNKLNNLFEHHGMKYELYACDRHRNFASQYEWIKKQEYDFVYAVEDDYLHDITCMSDMVSAIEFMKEWYPSEYAVFPFNNPHRYSSLEMLYPSYILNIKGCYWRSSFHSTHTFFVSRETFNAYDDVMRYQSYNWPNVSAVEDRTINRLWHEQRVKLITPLKSLAFHLADSTQEDVYSNWKQIWNDNLVL